MEEREVNPTPLRAIIMRILYEKPLLPECHIQARVWREYPCSESAISVELWRLQKSGMASTKRLKMTIGKYRLGHKLTNQGKRFYQYHFMEQ